MRMPVRRLTVIAGSLAGLLLAATPAISQHASPAARATYPVQLTGPVALPPQAHPGRPPREHPLHRPPGRPSSVSVADPVLQTSTPTPAAAIALGQWEGLGGGYPGFSVTAVPPDPNMAVGPNHIVQWVNNAFVVFDKHGAQVQAPVADSTFWGVLSTCYQGGGFSDPIVKYDRAADRWVVGEVAIPLLPGLFGQYAQCFAVSKTSDPTFVSDANGNNTSYNIWAYGFGANVNDYDKIAVWSDGYYVTWNIFQNGATFIGAEACAWNRNDMVNGVAAPAFVCFQLSNAYASLLASDLEGATAPPAGSPNDLMDIDPGSGALNLWKLHADFTTPSNSTFTGPTSISGVAPFTAPCPATQDCIPQPGTTQSLDALGDRLMYRVAYRNLGDHESIVASHTVLTTGGNTAVRWYEVRSPNGTPTLYQQGTFAPDTDNRWMGSIAMDQAGNIGVGYSAASNVTYPSIRYTGWEVGNPLGVLQAETSLVAGDGSQTGYNRWGDYSAMMTDPSDDCTFWYTQEYQATTQSADWNTRIGSFKFPSCGQTLTLTTTTLGSSLNPSTYGQSVTFTATVAPASGTATPTGSVTFQDGGAFLGTGALDPSGQATYLTFALATGSHSITALYAGNSFFGGSTSRALTQSVNTAATTTILTSSQNPSTLGQPVTFTATVSPPSGTGVPAGSVTFKDGGTTLGTHLLNSGQATFTTSALAAGSHSMTAVYPGNGNFTGSISPVLTQAVNLIATSTSVGTSLNPSNYGQSVTFTATVTQSSGTVTPTGIVAFKDSATTLGNVTLSNGQATLSTAKLSSGTHSITAVYLGSNTFAGSTSPVLTQMVNQIATSTSLGSSLNPSAYGQAVTFTAVVTQSSGTIVPTGTVILKDGSASFATITLNNGQAAFTTTKLYGGAHPITAVYAGNTNFSGSISPVLTQTVSAIATSTSVTSSPNPSTYGQAVTFTTTVTPSAGTIAPAGTVIFKDGSTNLGGRALSNGQAAFTIATLSGGVHAITVVYVGNTNFTASTSPTLAQTVNQIDTSASVTSSLNPSTFGQSVTLTAAVTPNSGTTAPAGSVTFKDGNTALATRTLSNGQAMYTTATLSAGGHSITVVYLGNANFTGSASPVLTQTVNPLNTGTTLVSSLNPSTLGQSVTFTATVTPSSGTATPNGSVTFMDGATTLGTKTLSSGKAAFATTSLTVGAHSITAVYGGGTNFNGSTPPPLTQTVN